MSDFDFQLIVDGFNELLDKIKNDPQLFWLVIGAAVIILMLLIIIICVSAASKKKSVRIDRPMQRAQYINTDEAKAFLPIETETVANEPDFLSLSDKILQSNEHIDDELRQRLIKQSPKSLEDIISAYPSASDTIKQELSAIVYEQNMLTAYAEKTLFDNSAVHTLSVAWSIFPDENAIDCFVEMLANRNEQVQMYGVKLLSQIKEPKSIIPLAMALMQPNRYITARVADVFAAIGQPGCTLLVYLLPEVSGDDKVRVLQTLSQIKADYSMENIAACLLDENVDVRVSAVETLSVNNRIDAVSALIMAADDDNAKVRAAAAKALGGCKDKTIIPLIKTLAEDDDWCVSVNAKDALVKISENTDDGELIKQLG